MSDVVTLVTAGGEMVGRLKDMDDLVITLERPRAFVQTEKGVGFAPSVCLTGVREPEEIAFNRAAIILMCDTAEEVSKMWLQATTGLVV
jgi:hypothetical protein